MTRQLVTVSILYGLCATSVVLLVIASWVPFQFHSMDPSSFATQFIESGFAHRFSKSDFIANVLAGIPIAFFLAGSLKESTAISMKTLSAAVVASVFALSLFVELGQVCIATRIASVFDVLAQTIGAGIGVVAWLVGGRRLITEFDIAIGDTSFATRGRAALFLIVVAVVTWYLLPFDLLTSPVDIARKYSAGRIRLVPFAEEGETIVTTIYHCVMGGLAAFPIALFLAQYFRARLGRLLSSSELFLLSVGCGIFPELLQIPLDSRVASSTDAAGGVLGALVAVSIDRLILSKRIGGEQPNCRRWFQTSAFWYSTAFVFGVGVCLASWYPFDFVSSGRELRERASAVYESPLRDLSGRNLNLVFRMLRMMIGSFILGGLLAAAAMAAQRRIFRHAGILLGVMVSIALPLLIELGQLLERNHTAGAFGVIVRFAAFAFFFVLVCWGLRDFSRQTTDE